MESQRKALVITTTLDGTIQRRVSSTCVCSRSATLQNYRFIFLKEKINSDNESDLLSLIGKAHNTIHLAEILQKGESHVLRVQRLMCDFFISYKTVQLFL